MENWKEIIEELKGSKHAVFENVTLDRKYDGNSGGIYEINVLMFEKFILEGNELEAYQVWLGNEYQFNYNSGMEIHNLISKADNIGKVWYNGSRLKLRTTYKQEEIKVEEFYSVDGKLLHEYNYKTYVEEVTTVDGEKVLTVGKLLHGLCKHYSHEGVLNFECDNFNGKKHGVERQYHENGTLYTECNYIKNEKQGIEKFFDTNSVLTKEIKYENGKPIAERKYLDGFLFHDTEGNVLNYKENGDIIEECDFNDGKELSSKAWKDFKY